MASSTALSTPLVHALAITLGLVVYHKVVWMLAERSAKRKPHEELVWKEDELVPRSGTTIVSVTEHTIPFQARSKWFNGVLSDAADYEEVQRACKTDPKPVAAEQLEKIRQFDHDACEQFHKNGSLVRARPLAVLSPDSGPANPLSWGPTPGTDHRTYSIKCRDRNGAEYTIVCPPLCSLFFPLANYAKSAAHVRYFFAFHGEGGAKSTTSTVMPPWSEKTDKIVLDKRLEMRLQHIDSLTWVLDEVLRFLPLQGEKGPTRIPAAPGSFSSYLMYRPPVEDWDEITDGDETSPVKAFLLQKRTGMYHPSSAHVLLGIDNIRKFGSENKTRVLLGSWARHEAMQRGPSDDPPKNFIMSAYTKERFVQGTCLRAEMYMHAVPDTNAHRYLWPCATGDLLMLFSAVDRSVFDAAQNNTLVSVER